MVVHLLIVDPQKDFCVPDEHGRRGALVVPGALDDMARVAGMIRRVGKRLDEIFVTMDSHQPIGIERPSWWVRESDRSHAAPFTCLGIHPDGRRIVRVDFSTGSPVFTDETYTTYVPSLLHKGGAAGTGSFGYLQALAAKQRYPHIVWPPHCNVGSWGWSLVDPIDEALTEWALNEFAKVQFVVKGNNPDTEHFSGVLAEVPDPRDPGTLVNSTLVNSLASADIVAITGEALSHCVANTVRDIAANFPDPAYVRKLVLLTDATSNVPGFEFLGKAFVDELVAKGMQRSTTKDFLA